MLVRCARTILYRLIMFISLIQLHLYSGSAYVVMAQFGFGKFTLLFAFYTINERVSAILQKRILHYLAGTLTYVVITTSGSCDSRRYKEIVTKAIFYTVDLIFS